MKCNAKEVTIPLKRFENKRCVLLAVLVFLGLLVVATATILVMIFFGWRFTYQPELDNKWEAISAIATWVGVLVSAMGVIASFIAIWYAIQVPKKIADRQDKIALFEKRYECFQTFERCRVLYLQIKTCPHTVEDLRCMSRYMFGKPVWEEVTKEVVVEEILRYEYMIHQMQFLFPNISEKDAQKLYNSLQEFLVSVFNNEKVYESENKYVASMDEFIGKYASVLITTLNI